MNDQSNSLKWSFLITSHNLFFWLCIDIVWRKLIFGHAWDLRADVSKYRPEVCKSEKSKILKKIHKVALGKLLT